MFRSSNFDKLIENATSHLRLEPDWPTILLICDAIRQNDVTPKQAIASIKKKMQSQNPHTAYYALLILESVVKNCGAPLHDEVATKENCEMFESLIETTTHEPVKAKLLELIQAWAFAFRTIEKYTAVKDIMNILKTKGHAFPELREADAMFTSDTAPDWADGKVCHRCRVPFSFTVRKHHCRNCGQIFCAQCSAKMCTLPKYGIEKEVRVCDGCFVSLQQKPAVVGRAGTGTTDNELPAEYLSSSLAQQSQAPPRKSDQELKEEEELQLALALSQSEAEQKNRLAPVPSSRIFQKSPSPDLPIAPTLPSPSPVDEPITDPELAKYLNRDFWEQRKVTESPASPSAPSPAAQLTNLIPLKTGPEDVEISDFSSAMRAQVEIFVNRMKSNSSRGRSISNDSSVQTLFMNLTSLHSRLLTYIKQMDDKRMWYEQLQDKLTQVKDSRAALDVLRQEHQDKLRRIAEEQERQRQMQMANKLEILRKKKLEYLQYQRQLALQRIQEEEREMHIRQEQQKALYKMGGQYQFMQPMQQQMQQQQQPQHSPIHQIVPAGNVGAFLNYGYNQMQPQPLQQQQRFQGPIPPNNPQHYMPQMQPNAAPNGLLTQQHQGPHSGVNVVVNPVQSNQSLQQIRHQLQQQQVPPGMYGMQQPQQSQQQFGSIPIAMPDIKLEPGIAMGNLPQIQRSLHPNQPANMNGNVGPNPHSQQIPNQQIHSNQPQPNNQPNVQQIQAPPPVQQAVEAPVKVEATSPENTPPKEEVRTEELISFD